MANIKWVDKDLRKLLTQPPKVTAKEYGFTLDYVYTARRRAKNKLKESAMPTNHESGESFNANPEDGKIIRSWDVAMRGSDGEWEKTRNYLYDHTEGSNALEERDFLHQAAPVNIRPSKVKPVERSYESVLFFGDTQIGYRYIEGDYVPIHDEAAMMCFRAINKHIRPDKLVNLGDTVDFPTLSQWPADSNHFNTTESMQKALDRAHKYWAELGADNPRAEKYEVDSNHTIRVDRMALKALSQFYGVRRAGSNKEDYPFLTYAWLMNFEAIGVEFTSGYDAAELNLFDDLVALHGKETRSNGSTAEMMSKKYPTVSTVRGHDHRFQVHTTTDRDGEYRYHVVVPALCDVWGKVPGYHSAVDAMGHPVRRSQGWQQGAVELQRYEDGTMNWQFIPIKDGVAYYNGKKFDGNSIDT